jgi:hypothetical protein
MPTKPADALCALIQKMCGYRYFQAEGLAKEMIPALDAAGFAVVPTKHLAEKIDEIARPPDALTAAAQDMDAVLTRLLVSPESGAPEHALAASWRKMRDALAQLK